MEMNEGLRQTFTRLEVEESFKHMTPLKSPSPNGFGAYFFQEYWHLVKDEVSSTVFHFLNGVQLDSALNFTHITLIPMVQPISLCNVLYKIIAKTSANRLKKILPKIISHN